MVSSHFNRTVIACLLGACLFTVSCSQGILKSLGDLSKLRQQLIDKYHEKDLSVNLQNSQYLSIVFVNSPLNKRDRAERQQRARETAEFVSLNYAPIKQLSNILVSFMTAESHFIIFHYSSMIDSFVFDREGAEIGTPFETVDGRKPVAKFSAPQNETDISITRLQLEGDLNHGIALVPHYSVPGKVDERHRSPTAPREVSFDFASYADKQVFSANPVLMIAADDATIFSGNARLLLAEREPVAGAPQFLTARIPFQQFARITTANEIRITLGKKKFLLSSEDVSALREMTAYIKHSSEARK